METVAVIFGGRSTEHDISIITAIASVIKPLELSHKYQVEPIYISKEGAWYSDPKLKDISLYTSGKISEYIAKLKPIELELDGGFKIIKGSKLSSKKIRVDIVFPAMHGTFGEDGSLMGLLDLAGVPYVGCNTAAAALAMNKLTAKQLAEDNSVAVSPYFFTTKKDFENNPKELVKEITRKLNFPLFVKPTHLGSSIGISRVKNEHELLSAMEVAAHYDNQILVEEEVKNLIEVTLPIIGNDEPRPALLERPLTKPEDFFDFDTKYLKGGKKGKGSKGAQGYSEIPAKLDKALYKEVEETGLKIYKLFGLNGISRVDMLIDAKTKVIYFNEINPLPGGLYAHNFSKVGLSNVDLVLKLIDYAKERFNSDRALATGFSTNYLRQF